jgi:hypothetical protein
VAHAQHEVSQGCRWKGIASPVSAFSRRFAKSGVHRIRRSSEPARAWKPCGHYGFEDTGTPDYSAEARETALAQMKKAESFVMEWYNNAPDVQDRKIRNHG